MGIVRLLKPVLFVYECAKIVILAFVLFLQPVDPAGMPTLVYIAPSVLFPIMALFIWLNVYRYRAYLPLYMAGKCISIITLAVWILVSHTEIGSMESVFFGGDLFALAAVLLIKNKVYNFRRVHNSEEEQCE